jgi:hypothetical protein
VVRPVGADEHAALAHAIDHEGRFVRCRLEDVPVTDQLAATECGSFGGGAGKGAGAPS